MSECAICETQVHPQQGAWIDNTGGDVCGWNGHDDWVHDPDTRTVVVLSWVYWNGDEQGGGGFNWYEVENRDHAETAFAAEPAVWEPNPVRVRLLDVEVPAGLTGDDLTEWLDWRIDDLEFHLPAKKSWPEPEHACGMCDKPIVFDGVDDLGHRLWRCTNDKCGWMHTSKDCCASHHTIKEGPA